MFLLAVVGVLGPEDPDAESERPEGGDKESGRQGQPAAHQPGHASLPAALPAGEHVALGADITRPLNDGYLPCGLILDGVWSHLFCTDLGLWD
jgi:hypothetical protein